MPRLKSFWITIIDIKRKTTQNDMKRTEQATDEHKNVKMIA